MWSRSATSRWQTASVRGVSPWPPRFGTLRPVVDTRAARRHHRLLEPAHSWMASSGRLPPSHAGPAISVLKASTSPHEHISPASRSATPWSTNASAPRWWRTISYATKRGLIVLISISATARTVAGDSGCKADDHRLRARRSIITVRDGMAFSSSAMRCAVSAGSVTAAEDAVATQAAGEADRFDRGSYPSSTDRMLPSGALNHAIGGPYSRWIPRSSWLIPSYLSNRIPALASPSTAWSILSTGKFSTVNKAGSWSSFG